MSLRQVLLPEAAEELLEAAEWYESGRPGLGAEFVGAVEHAMSAAASMPLAAAPWPGSTRFRRRVMERFPYILIYQVRSNTIEYVAIAHTSREPGYWLKRERRASE
jgi:plasmid stabilization system protein ParE